MTTSKGLVLDLDFAEKSGTVAGDSSRYGNDGALNGCKWVEHGLEFNGSSDYVDVPDSPSLYIPNSTVSVFAKGLGASGVLLYKGSTATDREYSFTCIVGSPIRSNLYNLGAITAHGVQSSFNTVSGQWYHIVQTWNGTNQILYIDGIEVDSATPAVTSGNGTSDLFIGDYGGGGLNFNGSIDQVRIHNRALNASEIKTYYDSTKHRYK